MFDPYHKWLGILPKYQPPNHYRLLGLEAFESDLDVVEGAADRAMAYIRQYQSGEHAAQAAKLLNEIATARLCLLKPKTKTEYDSNLRKQLAVLEIAKDESPSFVIDSEIVELMKAAKLSPKSKRKKSDSSQGLLIAGGIGVAVCVLLLAVFLSGGGKKPPISESSQQEMVRSDPGHSLVNSAATTAAPTTDVSAISLIESKLVTEPVGSPVNFIQMVDLSRDTFTGDWKKEGTSLIGSQGGLYLPVKLPEDYQLNFSIKRITGNDTLAFGFVMAGRLGMVAFDAYGSKLCGMYLDGREPNANCTTRAGALFQNDQLSTVVLTVHPGHFNATVDGEVVIDWYGESNRNYCHPGHGLPNRESPFIAIAQASYRIESAVMIPIKPDPQPVRIARLEEWIDLMPLLDTERDASKGVWALNKNMLQSPGSLNARFFLPIAVPEEYSLSAEVELPIDSTGYPTVVFGLLAGKSRCSIPLANGSCIGIEKIDGVRWHENATRLTGTFIPPRKPVNIVCTVTKRGIRMDLDGRTLIQWSGDFRRLSPLEDWAPNDARKLFLGSDGSFKFRGIKIGPPLDQLKLPEQPPLTNGKPLDLLALIDANRDTLEGSWTKDGTTLRAMGNTVFCKLVIPCEVPADYQLTIRVARETGGLADNESMALNLPVSSSMSEIFIDGYASQASSLLLDHLVVSDRRNVTNHFGQVITPGSTHEIVVSVRKTGSKVVVGGKTIIDWSGNPDRLSMYHDWASPGHRISLCTHQARFRFEKLELELLESSSFPPVAKLGSDGNVLSILDPQRDSRKGEWKLDAKGLVIPDFPAARIRLPAPVPERYVLTTNVERRSGVQAFILGLLVGGNPCSVMIDGLGGTQAGLMQIDGLSYDNPTNLTRRLCKSPLLPMRQPVRIRCIVLPDTVIVDCGDKELIRWHGDSRRLSDNLAVAPPNCSAEDYQYLWIGAWESEFLIRELRLRPLTEDESARILSEFSGVFPTSIQADVPLSSARSKLP